MKLCFFIRNEDALEPRFYCGNDTDMDDVLVSLSNFIKNEVENMVLSGDSQLNIQITTKQMTDDQIENLKEY